jgi:hypothetical protein
VLVRLPTLNGFGFQAGRSERPGCLRPSTYPIRTVLSHHDGHAFVTRVGTLTCDSAHICFAVRQKVARGVGRRTRDSLKLVEPVGLLFIRARNKLRCKHLSERWIFLTPSNAHESEHRFSGFLSLASFGIDDRSWSVTLRHCSLAASASSWAKAVAMKAETTRRPLLPAWAIALRMKWTRQRCQLAVSTFDTFTLMPSWASGLYHPSLARRQIKRQSDLPGLARAALCRLTTRRGA